MERVRIDTHMHDDSEKVAFQEFANCNGVGESRQGRCESKPQFFVDLVLPIYNVPLNGGSRTLLLQPEIDTFCLTDCHALRRSHLGALASSKTGLINKAKNKKLLAH